MNIRIRNLSEPSCACEALILPLFEGKKGVPHSFPPGFRKFVSGLSDGVFSAKHGEVFFAVRPDAGKPRQVLFVGLGKREELTPERLRQAGGKAMSQLRSLGITDVAVSASLIRTTQFSPAVFLEGGLLGQYTFPRYRREKDAKGIRTLTILAEPSSALKNDVRSTAEVAAAVSFARDLVNTPANDMTPGHLARAALSLKRPGLSVSVIERDRARRLGMGAFLAVASGSHKPPKFIVVEYRGSKKPPLVLIGKSVTFDSGGLSLKPSDGMEKMKYDMAGGAAVLGAVKAAAALGLPVHVIGLLPATENLPGGSATKPGDVVSAVGGKTIEIANTDAEGRLTIADAIGYAKRFRPRAVVDIATLTGACTITFGAEAIAMMGNDRKLLDRMKKAGEDSYERVWEMPLFEEYRDYLKSDIADIRNIGNRIGGLMTSAYFLYEFAEKTPWVHLDIAGTAWTEKDKPYMPKGASGVGVRLLLNFIKELK